METLMADRVQSSLSQFMHRNAIFLCERLCAEFPTELNLQLMATCYLRNNQPYCAYHVLKDCLHPVFPCLSHHHLIDLNLVKVDSFSPTLIGTLIRQRPLVQVLTMLLKIGAILGARGRKTDGSITLFVCTIMLPDESPEGSGSCPVPSQ
ncbi:hypothetical protein M5K25_015907 [Dendrobium thyrsiflorum]|uniref:CCR4-NOT transcription complex subunit 11 n=1 Tax=Dendrobium thyrsiflorum TaxID=117978 RepID=A0ABD0UYD1_DENTH